MPFQPNNLHIDRLLTNISIAVMNEQSAYIAPQVFPLVEVRKASDIIPKYDEYAWLADEAQIRAPAGESEGSGWTTDHTMKYSVENYAFHKDIPLEIRENADEPYDLDAEAAMYCVDRIFMKIEKNFATDFFATGKWATDNALTGTNKWSDPTSDIFAQHEVAKLAVDVKIAREPNTWVMSREVKGRVLQHPDVIDRMKTTSDKVPTVELLARLFEYDRILVGRAINATNKEGQTLAVSRVLGKHSLQVYVPPRASLMTPAAGYTFVWPILGRGRLVFTRRIPLTKQMADRIECHTYLDQKITATNAGYFFADAVA